MTQYRESQVRSAELLRMALLRMAEHPAAYNPITYAVWYEHLGGINPALSRAIDKRVDEGLKLDDEFVQQLYRAHVAELDAEAAERVSGDFRRVMQTLSETAARTGGSATELGQRLGALHEALESTDPQIRARGVSEALQSTAQLRGSLDSLQQQVASSRGEIEALREELQRTRAEAVLCPLTRVLNRKGFDERLQELLNAEGGAPSFSLVMIDIDHFKQINDEHGHLIGDRVLEALGEVLRRVLANKGASVARYGGEEFGILLPGRGKAGAVLLAEQLRDAVKLMRIRQRASDKIVLKVTISAGVAVARDGDDAASLVDRADSALYQSKHEGRDRVTAVD